MLIPLGIDTVTGQMRPIVDGESLVTPGGLGVPGILSTTPVDLTSAGVTPLYTVPASKKLVVMQLVVRCTSGAGTATDPQVNVGSNVAADNMVPLTTLIAFELTDHVWVLEPSNPFVLAVAAEQVKFEVDTPAGATILDAEVDLVGYLI